MDVNKELKKLPARLRWLIGNLDWYKTKFDGDYDSPREQVTDIKTAQVVSSRRTSTSNKHAVLLDLDVPAFLIPSSTPEHSHLYIDVTVPEENYFDLLQILAQCGIIEEGYADASIARGHSDLRLPWVKKKGITHEEQPPF